MKQLKLNFDGVKEDFFYRSQSNYNNYKLKPYDGDTGTTVQPVVKDYLQFSFIGRNKIESHKDVANLMAVLESKSAEHFFVVHVNKNGDPLIQYIATGNRDSVVVDKLNIHAVASFHNTKDLYLVHNHPSGNLKPSKADISLTENIVDGFSFLNINVNHLIINTYKKEYVLLDNESRFMNYPREMDNMDFIHRAVTLHDMDILREPIGKVTNSKDAFTLIQQKRFSANSKFGVFVLATNNTVVANFLVEEFNLKSIAKALTSVPNGVSVIGYGNREVGDIKTIQKKLDSFGVPLLDYIQFNSNSIAVKEAYKSYADNDLLREVQEIYGTNSVYKESAVTSIKR